MVDRDERVMNSSSNNLPKHSRSLPLHQEVVKAWETQEGELKGWEGWQLEGWEGWVLDGWKGWVAGGWVPRDLAP